MSPAEARSYGIRSSMVSDRHVSLTTRPRFCTLVSTLYCLHHRAICAIAFGTTYWPDSVAQREIPLYK